MPPAAADLRGRTGLAGRRTRRPRLAPGRSGDQEGVAAAATGQRSRFSLPVPGTFHAWRVPGCLIQPWSPSGSRSPRLTPRGSTRCWDDPSSPGGPALNGAGRSSGQPCGTTRETPRQPIAARTDPLNHPLPLSPQHPLGPHHPPSQPRSWRPLSRSRRQAGPVPLPRSAAPSPSSLPRTSHRPSLSARIQPTRGTTRPAPAPRAEPFSGTEPRQDSAGRMRNPARRVTSSQPSVLAGRQSARRCRSVPAASSRARGQ